MVFVVRLLIVEDHTTEVTVWQNTIDMHNSEPEKHGFIIEPCFVSSLPDALNTISSRDFDAAVVDIRLEQSAVSGPNTDGNEVVAKLLDSELAVVAVFTGETPAVTVPVWAGALVQTFRKGGDDGEGTPAVMIWLCKQMPMIKTIRQAQQSIKNEMVKLFTRSIWPRWSNWMQQDDPDGYLGAALSRHLASHVHAALLEDAKQKAHPEEWYFIPPIRQGVRTGDLIRKETGELVVIITPRCDLANVGKVETIQVAECKIVIDEWQKRVTKISQSKAALKSNEVAAKVPELAKNVSDAESSLRNFTQHSGNKASVHFLPPMKLSDGSSLGPFMVQFDKIKTIYTTETEEIDKLSKNRLASLTPEFLPSLIERLGGFFSRIGTPDYSHPD